LRPASASLPPGAEGHKGAGGLVDAVALVIGKAPIYDHKNNGAQVAPARAQQWHRCEVAATLR